MQHTGLVIIACISAGLLLLAPIWRVAKVVIGAFVPVGYVAPRYLAAQLRKHGVDPSTLSAACLYELAMQAASAARFLANYRRSWRVELPDLLEGTAVNVSLIVYGDEYGAVDSLRARPSPIIDVLAKHDPVRFSWENLAQTQAANRLLRKTVV